MDGTEAVPHQPGPEFGQFGDLTGEDARPTLWRGRPRPRRRRFSAGYERFHIGPIPEGRGEPGLKMIRITAFAEKSDQACVFFLRNVSWSESPRRDTLFQSFKPNFPRSRLLGASLTRKSHPAPAG